MSFQIIVMTTKDPKNQVKKTTQTLATLNGMFRNETSIINPTVLVEGDISAIAAANYLYIPTFKRYYYITDLRSIRSSLYEISAHVDVLMSHQQGILSNSAIIKRQQNKWNLYLNDGSFTSYQNPMVLTKNFPQGFTGGSFVLAVAGS